MEENEPTPDADKNTPPWALRIINLLQDQNARLETIAEKSNEIADVSNSISAKTNILTIVTVIITLVAVVVSYMAYYQTEEHFSRSLETQKRNALMTEILTRQKLNLEWISEAQALDTPIDFLCWDLPNTNKLASKYSEIQIAEEIFKSIVTANVGQENRTRLQYLVSQTATLFPNADFIYDDFYVKDSYYKKVNTNFEKPIELNHIIYAKSLKMFIEAFHEVLFLPEFKHWHDWVREKIENPPNAAYLGRYEIDLNLLVIFEKDYQHNEFFRFFKKYYRNRTSLMKLEQVFSNIDYYVYDETFQSYYELNSIDGGEFDPRFNFRGQLNKISNVNKACYKSKLYAFYDAFEKQSDEHDPNLSLNENFKRWYQSPPDSFTSFLREMTEKLPED